MEKKDKQEFLDFKEIQELIKLVKKSQLNEFNLKNGDFKIEMKYGVEPTEKVVVPVQQVQAAPPPAPAPAPSAAPQTAAAPSAGDSPAAPAADEKLITVKAPMIGTFYRSPSPDKPPFVEVGDTVSEGQVLCIIEAMKLFNEIESELSGKIVKILVDDATPVEFDQPLFLVDPS